MSRASVLLTPGRPEFITVGIHMCGWYGNSQLSRGKVLRSHRLGSLVSVYISRGLDLQLLLIHRSSSSWCALGNPFTVQRLIVGLLAGEETSEVVRLGWWWRRRVISRVSLLRSVFLKVPPGESQEGGNHKNTTLIMSVRIVRKRFTRHSQLTHCSQGMHRRMGRSCGMAFILLTVTARTVATAVLNPICWGRFLGHQDGSR